MEVRRTKENVENVCLFWYVFCDGGGVNGDFLTDYGNQRQAAENFSVHIQPRS